MKSVLLIAVVAAMIILPTESILTGKRANKRNTGLSRVSKNIGKAFSNVRGSGAIGGSGIKMGFNSENDGWGRMLLKRRSAGKRTEWAGRMLLKRRIGINKGLNLDNDGWGRMLLKRRSAGKRSGDGRMLLKRRSAGKRTEWAGRMLLKRNSAGKARFSGFNVETAGRLLRRRKRRTGNSAPASTDSTTEFNEDVETGEGRLLKRRRLFGRKRRAHVQVQEPSAEVQSEVNVEASTEEAD